MFFQTKKFLSFQRQFFLDQQKQIGWNFFPNIRTKTIFFSIDFALHFSLLMTKKNVKMISNHWNEQFRISQFYSIRWRTINGSSLYLTQVYHQYHLTFTQRGEEMRNDILSSLIEIFSLFWSSKRTKFLCSAIKISFIAETREEISIEKKQIFLFFSRKSSSRFNNQSINRNPSLHQIQFRSTMRWIFFLCFFAFEINPKWILINLNRKNLNSTMKSSSLSLSFVFSSRSVRKSNKKYHNDQLNCSNLESIEWWKKEICSRREAYWLIHNIEIIWWSCSLKISFLFVARNVRVLVP